MEGERRGRGKTRLKGKIFNGENVTRVIQFGEK